jgi:uncharacterized membrane protein
MDKKQDTDFDTQATTRQNIGAEAADDLSAFSSLTVQFYRGEMERMTVWRTRLDQTTNWAVIVMVAMITWTFSNPDHPHYILLIGMLAVGAFLFIEAGRFRKYDAWRSRVRMLQEDLFANVYDPTGAENDDWRKQLGKDLCAPVLKMPFKEALTHRLRHIYGFLLPILLATWLFRIVVFTPETTWQQAASIANISGIVVLGGVFTVYLVLAGLAYRPVPWWQDEREFHPQTKSKWTRKE